jgi:hypothetical protein
MPSTGAVEWVVYSCPIKGSPDPVRGVCPQADWEALDRAKPGHFTLVRTGITNEGEAQRLARGTAGADRLRGGRPDLTTWPGEGAAGSAEPDLPAPG